MRRTRRNLLGIALLGATGPLLAAAPRRPVTAVRLDAALAAIARDPACELASRSVVAALYRCTILGRMLNDGA